MKRLFAVIHVVHRDQAVLNSAVAAQAGCDGVFLISHGKLDWFELLQCVKPCQTAISYVGVNFLDLDWNRAKTALEDSRVSALWMDETHYGPRPENYEVFSGYAFKYKPQPRNLAEGAQLARHACHVLTTSGPGTGKPASTEKVAALREAIGPAHRLALASGVDEHNVFEYLPYVDDFLVASGINRTWEELDLGKAKALADIIHGHSV